MLNVAIGCWLGFKAEKLQVPGKVAKSRREIPQKVPCYSYRLVTIGIGSVLIGACLVTEVFYVVTSLWRHQYYFMYFYLALGFLLMAIVAQTVSIVQTYIALSVGDYNWWWRSFMVGFLVGAHSYAVCTYYYFFLEPGSSFAMEVSFALWSLLMCTLVGLVSGTNSFVGSYLFVKRIYKQVHEDRSK